MWRLKIYVLLLLFPFVDLIAQNEDDIKHIIAFSGVEDVSDLEPDEVERLSDILRNPIKINMSEKGRLLQSGLLSAYQVASLLDYRSRFGDVLSLMELSSLDGYNEDFVRKLSPFITLKSALSPGERPRDKMYVRNDLSLRGSTKLTGPEFSWNYGFRYRLTLDDNWKLSAGMTADNYSASVAYSGRGADLILGDFNARFGQGLSLWSGSFYSSFSSPDNFMRKPSGVTSVTSFTGSTAYTGIAAAVDIGSFSLTGLIAAPGLKTAVSKPQKLKILPALNLRWWSRFGYLSLMQSGTVAGIHNSEKTSLESMVTSVDAAFCVKGVNIFGEAAYDWMKKKVSALAGTDFQMGEKLRAGCVMKHIQSDRSEFAAGGTFSSSGYTPVHLGKFCLDAIYYHKPKDKNVRHNVQIKANIDWEWNISDVFNLKMRLSERIRTWDIMSSTQLRTDLSTTLGNFMIISRFHALYGKGFSVLSYLDGVYEKENLTLRLRTGLFKVDDWDDRIYVYEYDAPGSFNVPAFYGRGVWTAGYLSWKAASFVRLYFRASYIAYPFMYGQKKKPGKAELKLQLVFRF